MNSEEIPRCVEETRAVDQISLQILALKIYHISKILTFTYFLHILTSLETGCVCGSPDRVSLACLCA